MISISVATEALKHEACRTELRDEWETLSGAKSLAVRAPEDRRTRDRLVPFHVLAGAMREYMQAEIDRLAILVQGAGIAPEPIVLEIRACRLAEASTRSDPDSVVISAAEHRRRQDVRAHSDRLRALERRRPPSLMDIIVEDEPEQAAAG